MSAAEQQEYVHVGPQPGPQTEFLQTNADIAIYGGAAGGGKSYALLLEPLRHFNNPRFGAVIFRRNSTQVRNEGGLWDESLSLYGGLGAHPREAFLEWVFPTGIRVKFAHLELDRSVFDWQGSQIPFIGFDELTHFTEKQFFYMLSRNRSVSGVKAYVRATCNPDADSWVRRLIDWWVGDDGLPVKERSGILRWFIRVEENFIWGNSPEELTKTYGSQFTPKSLTFIPAQVEDNKILMEKDPGYISNLNALSRVDRERLRKGNWDIRATAGQIFQRGWFQVLDAIPNGFITSVRFWDRAATKPNETNADPDWTRGLKMYKYPNNTWLVADVRSLRDSPGEVEKLIKNTATHDGPATRIVSQKDPGSAGVMEAQHFVRMLAGFDARVFTTSRHKLVRAKPVSAQAEAGNIFILRAPWNDEFFQELENFPEGSHDDIVDVLSGAFNELSGGLSTADVL